MPPLRPCSALVIILVVIQAPQVFSNAKCFFRDGSEDYSASPCPSLYNTAMCCWLNRTDGYEPDVCTPQGFCISGQFWGELFLDSCTSGNWEGNSGCSPVPAACGEFNKIPLKSADPAGSRHLCADLFDVGTIPSQYTTVTQCTDGSFCCTGSNDTCCSNGSGIYLSADGRQIISRETTQGSNTSCIQGSNTSFIQGSNTSSIQSSDTSCIALRAGVGVVSAVAGIVVILLAVVIFRYQKIGGPRYKLSIGGKRCKRGVPSQQPPYELEATD
jgi:hypothetical protein